MLSIQTTPPIPIRETYKRHYPLYTSVRIRNSNLEKIKARARRYNQSVDDLITEMLQELEYQNPNSNRSQENRGYEVKEDQRSW